MPVYEFITQLCLFSVDEHLTIPVFWQPGRKAVLHEHSCVTFFTGIVFLSAEQIPRSRNAYYTPCSSIPKYLPKRNFKSISTKRLLFKNSCHTFPRVTTILHPHPKCKSSGCSISFQHWALSAYSYQPFWWLSSGISL